LPKTYIKIRTICKKIEDFWELSEDFLLPPFEFDGKYVYSFCSYEKLAPIHDALIGKPMNLETNELMDKNPQELIRLLNYHIDKLVKSRGLKKYKRNIYFFPPIIKEGMLEDRYVKSRTGRDRRVTRPIYETPKDNETKNRLYYVFHEAVKLSSKIYWNKNYIELFPVFHFTSDGFKPIEGRNKDRLDRKYRNPIYSRNYTILSWVKFWKYFLFDKEFYSPLIAQWFEDFKFKDLENLEIMGIPESVDKDQKRLSEFVRDDE